MADRTTAQAQPTFLSRFFQAFREHTGIRISTLTAIVYAGLSLVFGIKAYADRPKNVVPIMQCAASICLSGLSVYGAKNNHHSHFNDKATKTKLAELDQRTQQLQEQFSKHQPPAVVAG